MKVLSMLSMLRLATVLHDASTLDRIEPILHFLHFLTQPGRLLPCSQRAPQLSLDLMYCCSSAANGVGFLVGQSPVADKTAALELRLALDSAVVGDQFVAEVPTLAGVWDIEGFVPSDAGPVVDRSVRHEQDWHSQFSAQLREYIYWSCRRGFRHSPFPFCSQGIR